jgi:hypothetical protein
LVYDTERWPYNDVIFKEYKCRNFKLFSIYPNQTRMRYNTCLHALIFADSLYIVYACSLTINNHIDSLFRMNRKNYSIPYNDSVFIRRYLENLGSLQRSF